MSSSSMRRRRRLQAVEASRQAQVRGAPVAGLAGQRGDGARLQREELVAAQRPLHVLRRLEVPLGAPRQAEHARHLVGRQRGRAAAVAGQGDQAHAVGRRRHHLETLGLMVLEQRAVAAVERPAVGLDDAVHEALVQAVHGFHQGLSSFSG